MIDMSEARRLMKQGLSDREIGERLGCCKQRIHTLRHRWQLPQRVQVMETRIKKGYESGLTRKEIQWHWISPGLGNPTQELFMSWNRRSKCPSTEKRAISPRGLAADTITAMATE